MSRHPRRGAGQHKVLRSIGRGRERIGSVGLCCCGRLETTSCLPCERPHAEHQPKAFDCCTYEQAKRRLHVFGVYYMDNTGLRTVKGLVGRKVYSLHYTQQNGGEKKSAERVSLAYLVRRTYGSVVRVADRSRRIGHASMAQICTADAHPVGSHAARC